MGDRSPPSDIFRYDTRAPGALTPVELIKWCRRNFGRRGYGWDFTYHSKYVILYLTEPQFKTMFTLWHQ